MVKKCCIACYWLYIFHQCLNFYFHLSEGLGFGVHVFVIYLPSISLYKTIVSHTVYVDLETFRSKYGFIIVTAF